MSICVFVCLCVYSLLRYRLTVILPRDGKTYKRASNACVNFFIAWVKYVLNFTLICCESELCCDFALLGVILMAFSLVSFYFYF